MKAMLTGIVVALVVAIGVGYVLPLDPRLSWQVFSSSSTRVADPGTNLVGPGWTGENEAEAPEPDDTPA